MWYRLNFSLQQKHIPFLYFSYHSSLVNLFEPLILVQVSHAIANSATSDFSH